MRAGSPRSGNRIGEQVGTSDRKKIALVTGGNRGLGKAMVLSLAGVGMDVVVTYNSNKAEGEAVVDAIRDAGGRAAALPFDLLAIRNNPGFQAMLVAQTAMGRPAEPQDIGGLVRLLCSDDARWLTGQRLEATGGYNL